MRSLLACLALAACATVPQPPPPERVAGCWFNRDVGAVSMRWHPSEAPPGAFTGTRRDYGQSGAGRTIRYSLEPSGEGWALCELDAAAEAATRCWQVAQGEGGSLEGGRAFIDRHSDRLRIAVLGSGAEQVIFQGKRNRCD